MSICYFDTSVFLAVLKGEPTAVGVRGLLRELRHEKVKIYTSILTIQEASVAAIRAGSDPGSLHAEISKFAKIQTITREIAITASILEGQILQKMSKLDLSEEERIGHNRRRKWDCFHIATALELHCRRIYTFDEQMLNRKNHLDLPLVDFSLPTPRISSMFSDPAIEVVPRVQ